MRALLVAGLISLISSPAFSQTSSAVSSPGAQPQSAAPVDDGPGTPTGHEFTVSLGGYKYVEPGSPSISIHGAKVAGEYSDTLPLSTRRRWFARAEVRGSLGRVTYDGACAPWLITPNGSSPNGYELTLGDFSPCSETGDADWYVEGRALVTKDLIHGAWAWSPAAGVGVRDLSNGTTGIAGYRTDTYLYLPVGLSARSKVGSRAMSFTLEYDRLVHGWQHTRNSALGSGDIPPTATAPGFSIDSFSDISFSQHAGWAMRASGTYQATRHWSVTPFYVHWSVSSSPDNTETVVFTVNGVSAREQFGAYEPFNTTNEFGVKLGLHF